MAESLDALNQLQVRALLSHFQLRHTASNVVLVRRLRWLPRVPRIHVQGVYAIVDTNDWWMRVGQSGDVWRRCHVEHHGKLRRYSHPCLELQNDCSGIDGSRWRVLLLEDVQRGGNLRMRERWWRSHVKSDFEHEEHWARYAAGSRDRRPAW